MHSDAEVGGEYQDEGDVEEGPEVFGVDCPAVLGDRGHLVQTPAKTISSEYELSNGETQVLGTYRAGFVGHC